MVIFISNICVCTARKRRCGKVMFLLMFVCIRGCGQGCVWTGAHTPLPKMEDEAGGTHPTGMHFCFNKGQWNHCCLPIYILRNNLQMEGILYIDKHFEIRWNKKVKERHKFPIDLLYEGNRITQLTNQNILNRIIDLLWSKLISSFDQFSFGVLISLACLLCPFYVNSFLF